MVLVPFSYPQLQQKIQATPLRDMYVTLAARIFFCTKGPASVLSNSLRVIIFGLLFATLRCLVGFISGALFCP